MITVSRIDRELVNHGAQLNPTLQRLYSIFLWDLTTQEVVLNRTLDPAFGIRRKAAAEYFFEVTPKVHEVSEPFATRVIATQNGGKFIESQGSIFKEFRVQGTTGLRPRKSAPTQIPLLGLETFESLAQGFGNVVTEIPNDEATGFDDIHFLRNIFRHYSDLKSTGNKVVMVWRNIKDDDYWIVEPKDFRLVQNSKSPLTYEYQITLQGISRFTGTVPVDIAQDPLAAMRAYNRLMSRIQGFQQDLTNAFLVISTNITRIQGAGYTTISNILGPVTSVIRGLNSVTTAYKQTVYGIVTTCRDAIDDFSDAITTLSKTLEEDRRDEVVRSLLRSISTFSNIIADPFFQDSIPADFEGRSRRASSAYYRRGGTDSAVRPPNTGGSPTLPQSGNVTGVSEDRVRSGEDINHIAKRLLGDARRWKELVLLNDLSAPYVSGEADPGEGVLRVGDIILYPSKNGIPSDTLATQTVNLKEEVVNDDGILAQTYGRDIRLKSTKNDKSDIAVNQRGDIAAISGIANVKQAVLIKFSTEQGNLPAHPYFGSRFPIGSKSDITSFHTFRLNTISTILSDSRISEVLDLNFETHSDVLSVSAKLQLKESSHYTSTNFAVRRL